MRLKAPSDIPTTCRRTTYRSAMYCLLVCCCLTVSAGPVAAQTEDATPLLQNWMRCAADTYATESAHDSYDSSAHAAAWAACKAQRAAALEAIPDDQKDAYAQIFRAVLDSLVATAVAKANQFPGYGLNQRQAVPLGGGASDGVIRAMKYLGRLRGPDGQRLSIRRVGSCCAFDTPNAPAGHQGRLDVYDVSYDGHARPATVYVNTYDEGQLDIVDGFTRPAVESPKGADPAPTNKPNN